MNNLHFELVAWFAEQALRCSERLVTLLMVFPQDSDCHSSTGPASCWSMREVRLLQDLRKRTQWSLQSVSVGETLSLRNDIRFSACCTDADDGVETDVIRALCLST